MEGMDSQAKHVQAIEAEVARCYESPIWERNHLDFKASEAVGDPRCMDKSVIQKKDADLLEDMASFANTNGGYLVFGVEDENKGRRIQGFVMLDEVKQRLMNKAKEHLDPPPGIEIEPVLLRGELVTVLRVSRGGFHPCVFNGTVFIRSCKGKERARSAQIVHLVLSRMRDLGITLNDASMQQAINRLEDLIARQDPLLRIEGVNASVPGETSHFLPDGRVVIF